MRDIHEFLSHFHDVKGNHPQYHATCPVCQKKDHLYIKDVGNRVLVFCQKCQSNFHDIMSAVGLNPQDAFYTAPEMIAGDSREHIYTTADGEVFAKKTIKSMPDGKKNCYWNVWNGNGWTTGLCGKTAPLYNYAELTHTSGTVYFAEGEKDAETLSRMGYTSTTGPNGANGTKWSDEYTEVLKGRDIVILTDNDDKGEKYGEFIADHVVDTAASVKIVPAVRIMPTIKVKGDITDIVETVGETDAKEALERAISMIPVYTRPAPEDILDELGFYNVEDLSEEERKPPEFIVEGMIPVGLSFIIGASKIRKSFLVLDLAVHVALGTEFLGRKTKQVSVCYFDLEGSPSRISERLKGMGKVQPKNLLVTNSVTKTLADGLLEAIAKISDTHKEFRLFVIDMYSIARGALKSNGSNAYDFDVQTLAPVHRLAVEKNIAILFVHHEKKGADSAGDVFERGSGSIGIVGSSDSILNLIGKGKRSEGRAKLEISPRDVKGDEMELQFDESCLTWKVVGAEEQRQALEKDPFCKWAIEHAPDEGRAFFLDYRSIYKEVTGGFSEKAADEIKQSLIDHAAELGEQYRIRFGMDKSNGKSGIRFFRSYY